jgi:hypothetical protein
VFQAPYLIPFLDVTDNVALLPMLAGRPNGEARARALELLDRAGRGAPRRRPAVASCRAASSSACRSPALANRPPVILADEPTAPLDSERALAVVRILNQMAAQYHTAIIVVTHDEKIIPTFKRIYHIRDGRGHRALCALVQAGFAYVACGLGLWRRQRWSVPLAVFNRPGVRRLRRACIERWRVRGAHRRRDGAALVALDGDCSNRTSSAPAAHLTAWRHKVAFGTQLFSGG